MDEYLEGVLSPGDATLVQRHLGDCPSCAAELRALAKLRQELARLPAPAVPDQVLEGLLARAIRARERPRRESRRQWASVGAAAVLLLGLGFGLGVHFTARKPLNSETQVALAVQPIRLGVSAEPVGLMFRTSEALTDATISIWLPEGVELEGRPAVRHLSWRTDLKSGANLLELPLKGVGAHGGTLIVRLSRGTLVKTLQVPIEIRQQQAPGAAARSVATAAVVT